MTTIIINERTKAGKALLELATILSTTTKAVTIDTNGLAKPAVLKTKTLKKITSKEDLFYSNFKKSLTEADKIKKGLKKGISLQTTLNEI